MPKTLESNWQPFNWTLHERMHQFPIGIERGRLGDLSSGVSQVGSSPKNTHDFKLRRVGSWRELARRTYGSFSLVTPYVTRFTTNMERLTLTRGNPDAFLSTLVKFCEDSLSTCFSRDADELCVPIGLSSLSMLLLLISSFLWVLFSSQHVFFSAMKGFLH